MIRRLILHLEDNALPFLIGLVTGVLIAYLLWGEQLARVQ